MKSILIILLMTAISLAIKVCDPAEKIKITTEIDEVEKQKETRTTMQARKYYIKNPLKFMSVKVTRKTHFCSGKFNPFGEENCHMNSEPVYYQPNDLKRMWETNKCLVGASCSVDSCTGSDAEICRRPPLLDRFVPDGNENDPLGDFRKVILNWCYCQYECTLKTFEKLPYFISSSTLKVNTPFLSVINISSESKGANLGNEYLYYDKMEIKHKDLELKCISSGKKECIDPETNEVFEISGQSVAVWNSFYELMTESQEPNTPILRFNGEYAKAYDLNRVYSRLIFENMQSLMNSRSLKNRIQALEKVVKSILYFQLNATSDPLEILLNYKSKPIKPLAKDEIWVNPCFDRQFKEMEKTKFGENYTHSFSLFREFNMSLTVLGDISYNLDNYLQSTIKRLEDKEIRNSKSPDEKAESASFSNSFLDLVFILKAYYEKWFVWVVTIYFIAGKFQKRN